MIRHPSAWSQNNILPSSIIATVSYISKAQQEMRHQSLGLGTLLWW